MMLKSPVTTLQTDSPRTNVALSQIDGTIPMNKTPSRRFGASLITAIMEALLLAMNCGRASAQSNGVIGRAFTGVAISIDPGNGLLTVESKGAVFQVTITDSTIINNPPDTGKPAKCMSRSPPRQPAPRSTQAIQS